MANGKWKKEKYNEDSIIWSNLSEKGCMKIMAKKLPSNEWKMWPEINKRQNEEFGSIIVPNKRCVVSMISSMKDVINNYLKDAIRSGKTIEEEIKSRSNIL